MTDTFRFHSQFKTKVQTLNQLITI